MANRSAGRGRCNFIAIDPHLIHNPGDCHWRQRISCEGSDVSLGRGRGPRAKRCAHRLPDAPRAVVRGARAHQQAGSALCTGVDNDLHRRPVSGAPALLGVGGEQDLPQGEALAQGGGRNSPPADTLDPCRFRTTSRRTLLSKRTAQPFRPRRQHGPPAGQRHPPPGKRRRGLPGHARRDRERGLLHSSVHLYLRRGPDREALRGGAHRGGRSGGGGAGDR